METIKDTPYGDIMSTPSIAALKRAVAGSDRGAHFFSRDTMRWFGTRNVHMVGGCVVVGLDTKTPEGIVGYWARVFRVDGQSEVVARASSRATIDHRAAKIARELREGTHVPSEPAW